jgi:hypothetical protein
MIINMPGLQKISARVPLTLTLSRGEREQPLVNFLKFGSHGAESSRRLGETLGTFLPLPEGEGRGEGKRGFSFEPETKAMTS